MYQIKTMVANSLLKFLNNFRIYNKMNFTKAVKGKLTRNIILREIDSKSELEIGRHLDPAEKSSLFCKFSPQLVFDRIQQVQYKCFRYLLYLLLFSLVMVLWSLWCFCQKDLSLIVIFLKMSHPGMGIVFCMVSNIV